MFQAASFQDTAQRRGFAKWSVPST